MPIVARAIGCLHRDAGGAIIVESPGAQGIARAGVELAVIFWKYGGAATAYFFAHLVMIFGVLALAAVPVGTAVSPAVELVTVAAVIGYAFAI